MFWIVLLLLWWWLCVFCVIAGRAYRAYRVPMVGRQAIYAQYVAEQEAGSVARQPLSLSEVVPS